MKSPNNNLLNLATNSQSLQNRAAGNQQFSSADFNGWVKDLFEPYSMDSVLDICCGTGNQLVIYAEKSVKSITGLDISSQSIEKAQQRLIGYQGDLNLVSASMEDYLSNSPDNSKDFISSFYGLYYSKNINKTCQQVHNVLQTNGHFLICGPYGNNNASLFSLLEKYYTLPEFVTYSSATFMEETLAPILSSFGMSLEENFFVNTISYPSTDAVISYLKSSTFFNDKYINEIKSDLNQHFENHTSFAVEKHVMALIAKKNT